MPKGIANAVQPWPDGRWNSGGSRRKTHCCRGHLLTPETTYHSGSWRACKQCVRERGRFYAAQRRLARMAGEELGA